MKMRRPKSWVDFILTDGNVPAKVKYTTGDGDYFEGAVVNAWDVCGNFIAVTNPNGNDVWVRKSRLEIISRGTVL